MFPQQKRGNDKFSSLVCQIAQMQGGFVLDGGVHFVAGLRLVLSSGRKLFNLSCILFYSHCQCWVQRRILGDFCICFKRCVLSCPLWVVVQITGAEVTSVSAIARHLDSGLPPPDNVSALLWVLIAVNSVCQRQWPSFSCKKLFHWFLKKMSSEV